MSLQSIIDSAQSIQIVRRKLAGQTVSRSGHLKVSSVASAVPFQFTVKFRPGLKYSTNRALLEEIDRLDRVLTENVDIGNSNTGLSYITEYQGELSLGQLGQITVSSGSNLTLTLNVSAVTGATATDVVFRAGDFVQIASGYKYPYTVTDTVLKGSGSTIDVPISRPFIDQSGFTEAGKGILVGPDVSWQVIMTKKPSYTILPYDIVEFNSDFELVEVVED